MNIGVSFTCYMQLGVCVSFGVIYVNIEDIYHITVLSSGEPEAACHAFSTILCVLVGMPVTSHLIPNLQLLHLNSASICCSFLFLKYYTEIHTTNACILKLCLLLIVWKYVD